MFSLKKSMKKARKYQDKINGLDSRLEEHQKIVLEAASNKIGGSAMIGAGALSGLDYYLMTNLEEVISRNTTTNSSIDFFDYYNESGDLIKPLPDEVESVKGVIGPEVVFGLQLITNFAAAYNVKYHVAGIKSSTKKRDKIKHALLAGLHGLILGGSKAYSWLKGSATIESEITGFNVGSATYSSHNLGAIISSASAISETGCAYRNITKGKRLKRRIRKYETKRDSEIADVLIELGKSNSESKELGEVFLMKYPELKNEREGIDKYVTLEQANETVFFEELKAKYGVDVSDREKAFKLFLRKTYVEELGMFVPKDIFKDVESLGSDSPYTQIFHAINNFLG